MKLDEQLVARAMELGGHKTAEQAVTAALKFHIELKRAEIKAKRGLIARPKRNSRLKLR